MPVQNLISSSKQFLLPQPYRCWLLHITLHSKLAIESAFLRLSMKYIEINEKTSPLMEALNYLLQDCHSTRRRWAHFNS